MFEYKVKCRHRLGWKEIKLYADTDIEEFFNRNGIEYVRNITDTIEHRQLKEIERLEEELDKTRLSELDKEYRINKAIEYIESYMPNYDFDKTNLIKLLEILDKENK